jgi:hypothetical protein
MVSMGVLLQKTESKAAASAESTLLMKSLHRSIRARVAMALNYRALVLFSWQL